MADFSSNYYTVIPAGIALVVVPTVLIESQWRIYAKWREGRRVREREKSTDRQARGLGR